MSPHLLLPLPAPERRNWIDRCLDLHLNPRPGTWSDGLTSAGESAGESACDRVPDHVCQRRLRAPRHRCRLTRRVEYDGLGLGASEDLAAAHVVDDQQVAPLARELGLRVLEHA